MVCNDVNIDYITNLRTAPTTIAYAALPHKVGYVPLGIVLRYTTNSDQAFVVHLVNVAQGFTFSGEYCDTLGEGYQAFCRGLTNEAEYSAPLFDDDQQVALRLSACTPHPFVNIGPRPMASLISDAADADAIIPTAELERAARAYRMCGTLERKS